MSADTPTLDAAARDFTPISAAEAQSFLAHARKDFRSEENELGYVPVQPCDLERLSLTVLALLASVRGAEADTARLDWLESHEMTMRVDFDGACREPWSVYYEQAARLHDHLRGEGDTLRAAIDAARSATPTGADHAE